MAGPVPCQCASLKRGHCRRHLSILRSKVLCIPTRSRQRAFGIFQSIFSEYQNECSKYEAVCSCPSSASLIPINSWDGPQFYSYLYHPHLARLAPTSLCFHNFFHSMPLFPMLHIALTVFVLIYALLDSRRLGRVVASPWPTCCLSRAHGSNLEMPVFHANSAVIYALENTVQSLVSFAASG